MSRLGSIIAMLFVTFLGSCGTRNHSTLESTSKPITFVLAAGFGSCKFNQNLEQMDMINKFKELVSKAKSTTGRPVHMLRSCFHIPTRSTVTYGYGLNKTNEFQVSLNEYVNQILPSYLKGDVYMIGHSYGGWMVMKSALRRLAKNSKTFELKGLFTIDPISWKECNISAVIRSYFGFGYANAPTPACTRAPEDLKSLFGLLARNTTIWHNFYQVTFPILHSGMIYQATKNTMPELPLDRQITGHHATIMNSAKVWQHINSDVADILL